MNTYQKEDIINMLMDDCAKISNISDEGSYVLFCIKYTKDPLEEKVQDIQRLKHYITLLPKKYDSNQMQLVVGNVKIAPVESKIQEILTKYNDDQFYIMYQIYNKIYTNVVLLTLDEMNQFIPTGSDLKRLCYSMDDYHYYIDNKPHKFKFVDYPLYHAHVLRNNIEPCIGQLPQRYNNVHLVHPDLLEAAKFFYSI